MNQTIATYEIMSPWTSKILVIHKHELKWFYINYNMLFLIRTYM